MRLLVVLALLTACDGKPSARAPDAAIPGTPLEGTLFLPARFYFAGPVPADLKQPLAKCAALAEGFLWNPEPDRAVRRPTLAVRQEMAGLIPPPALEALRELAVDVSEAQQKAIQTDELAYVASVIIPAKQPGGIALLKRGHELVGCLAEASGALIWDDESRQLFSVAAWRERRVVAWKGELPSLTDHVVVKVDPTGRAVSLGMAKFGLPDVSVAGFPAESGEQVVVLINLVLAELARTRSLPASGKLRVQGPHGAAEVSLAFAPPAEGDRDHRQLTMALGDPEAQVLETLFGRRQPK